MGDERSDEVAASDLTADAAHVAIGAALDEVEASLDEVAATIARMV